jgi:hypothetical protein
LYASLIVPSNYVDNISGEKITKSCDFRAGFLTGLSTDNVCTVFGTIMLVQHTTKQMLGK